MDSLFLALRRFRPGPGRDPLEDFVTEAWAWLLRHHASLAETFIADLRVRARRKGVLLPPLDDQVDWQTQQMTRHGRLDLVAGDGQRAFVFVQKAWGDVDEGQIARFRAAARDLGPSGNTVVLVTASRRQWSGEADLELTWGDIEALVDRWRLNELRTPDEELLVRDFVALLRHEGLGRPAPLSEESIRSWLPAQSFLDTLVRLTRSLAEPEYWSFVYERFSCASGRNEPTLRWERGDQPKWGRCGVDVFPLMRPGIFFGVIFDGADHRVRNETRPGMGPDFALIFDYSLLDEMSPSVDRFVGNPAWRRLLDRLARQANGRSPGLWWFDDHVTGHPNPNRWHLMSLRRPVLDVMRGTRTFEEQQDAFIAAARDAFDLLVLGGELDELVPWVHDELANRTQPSIPGDGFAPALTDIPDAGSDDSIAPMS